MTYDRFGDSDEPAAESRAAAPTEETDEEHKKRCRGWLDRNADHPVPCLRCKPHLNPEIRRLQMGLGEKK